MTPGVREKGVPVDWLLLFLLLLSDLSSACDKTYVQDDTVVCTGRQARFNWKYKVKPFSALVWTHNGEEIASSASLTFAREVISSYNFKGRLKLNSKDPFLFTLENAKDVDNGTYECIFHIGCGKTECLIGGLEVKEYLHDVSLFEVKKKDRCVTLSCKTDPPCTWIFSNGISKVAKMISYCSKMKNQMIRCENEHVCKYANYTDCIKSNNNREKRSPEDALCPRDGSKSGDPGTDPGTDPTNPVPIVLGVLVPITAIAVITVIIVFYKRRSRTPREQEPPGSDNLVPMKDYKE